MKSIQRNTCAQIYTNGSYTIVYPMEQKAHVGWTLAQFIEDVRMPNELAFDLAPEMTVKYTEFMNEMRQLQI